MHLLFKFISSLLSTATFLFLIINPSRLFIINGLYINSISSLWSFTCALNLIINVDTRNSNSDCIRYIFSIPFKLLLIKFTSPVQVLARTKYFIYCPPYNGLQHIICKLQIFRHCKKEGNVKVFTFP